MSQGVSAVCAIPTTTSFRPSSSAVVKSQDKASLESFTEAWELLQGCLGESGMAGMTFEGPSCVAHVTLSLVTAVPESTGTSQDLRVDSSQPSLDDSDHR